MILQLKEQQKLILTAFLFGLLQFTIRLGCMHRYGFHQDELLYMALGDHLSWGFKETPPFIALASIFSKTFIGDSVFAMRILPSICAGLVIFFTGKITIRLGGKLFAVILACSGVAFSSAFLATGSLFIPQVFDELGWVLAAYLLVSWFKTRENKYLIMLGFVAGIGMQIKYTIFLYGIGLITGMLMSRETRIIFSKRSFWQSLMIAFLLFLPNLAWQINNGFPAIGHFKELTETQLVYISSSDFLIQQLFVNGTGIVLWFGGFILLIRQERFKQFRFLPVAFLFVIVVLVILSGKSYYAFGAYPPLFAAGGIFYEELFRKKSQNKRWAFFSALLVPNLFLMVIVLPYLPIEKTAKVFEWTYINLHIHFPLKWEDQKIHNMNQNYADMIGWDELAIKTARLYYSLSSSDQQNTVIVAENYGEAGAIDYYRTDYKLPKLISLSSSYSIWAPSNFTAKNMIYICDSLSFKHPAGIISKYDEVKNPYSRVKGLDIYLVRDVNKAFKQNYRREWLIKRLAGSFRL